MQDDALRHAQLINVDDICRTRVAQNDKHAKLSFVRGFARASSIKRISRSVRRMGSRFKRGSSGDKGTKHDSSADGEESHGRNSADGSETSSEATTTVGDGGNSRAARKVRLRFLQCLSVCPYRFDDVLLRVYVSFPMLLPPCFSSPTHHYVGIFRFTQIVSSVFVRSSPFRFQWLLSPPISNVVSRQSSFSPSPSLPI